MEKLREELRQTEEIKVDSILTIINEENASDYKVRVIELNKYSDYTILKVKPVKNKEYTIRVDSDGNTKTGFIENLVFRVTNTIDTEAIKSEIEVSNRIFNPDMAPDGYSKMIILNGEPIGEFALLDIGNEVHLSGSLGARTEIDIEYRGKGYGYQAYVELAKQVKSEGKVLVSSTNMTEDAIRVWEKLVKEGYANKVKRLVEGFDNFEEEVYIIDNSKLSISEITSQQI